MPVVTAPITPIVLNPGSTFDPASVCALSGRFQRHHQSGERCFGGLKESQPRGGGGHKLTPLRDRSLVLSGQRRQYSRESDIGKVYPVRADSQWSPPMGAPDPNGWDTVSVEPINPVSTGRQLWKAVQAPGSTPAAPIFYLRSAMSFKTGVDDAMYPGMLVGFGATGADLDLGYPSQFYYPFTPAIYMNQKAAPDRGPEQFSAVVL